MLSLGLSLADEPDVSRAPSTRIPARLRQLRRRRRACSRALHSSWQRRRTSCGEVWQQPYLSYQNLCNFPSNSKACEAQWCGCASPNTRSRGQFPILCAFPPFFMLILCILFSSYPEFLLILCVLFFFFFLAIP